jgi:hypothetical protein
MDGVRELIKGILSKYLEIVKVVCTFATPIYGKVD